MEYNDWHTHPPELRTIAWLANFYQELKAAAGQRSPKFAPTNPLLHASVTDYVRARKVQAIKAYRTMTAASLKEAIESVEWIMDSDLSEWLTGPQTAYLRIQSITQLDNGYSVVLSDDVGCTVAVEVPEPPAFGKVRVVFGDDA